MDTRRDDVFKNPLNDGIQFLPKKAGFYCMWNRINGRHYVGQAKNVYQRCLGHRSALRRGLAGNMLVRRDAERYGPDAFFFFSLSIDGVGESPRPIQVNNIEIWFAVQFCAHDERYGYNLVVGGHPTRATRFRNREQKLMRSRSRKYELLEGVDIYDPIAPDLLTSWIPCN